MYTIIYLIPNAPKGTARLVSITTPSRAVACDVADCLAASGQCGNVRVWWKGECVDRF